MHFTKMHGLGNDYLYVYDEVPENIVNLSVKYSDRHFGVGSDGMIFICHSDVADFKMRIFNADGSEAKMCGNGIRCVGKYVYDKGYTNKTSLKVDTLSGIKTLELKVEDGKVSQVTVGMGEVKVLDDLTLNIDGTDITMVPVSVGNPHAVIFVDNAEEEKITEIGPKIEHHPAFPEGVNVEFVSKLSDNKLRMRVWERGSGVTMACGTGACATAAASVARNYCNSSNEVSVVLDGGTLSIKVNDDNSVIMTGPAAIVCEGEIDENV